MADLTALKAAADIAGENYDKVCLRFWQGARWDGYRAIESDTAPKCVVKAMEDYHAATHAFYLARDGHNGFLGSRA